MNALATDISENSSSIRISLIIATYNRADCLLRTLNSVAEQSLNPVLYEIIVVNNNSTDHTAETCHKFADGHTELHFHMVTEVRQGLSHARNCGIAHASGDFFAIIDDDELINRDFLKNYYDFFLTHPTVAACGGIVTPLYEFTVPKWLSRYAERPIAGTLYYGEKIIPFPKGNFRNKIKRVKNDRIERRGADGGSLALPGSKDLV